MGTGAGKGMKTRLERNNRIINWKKNMKSIIQNS